MYDYIEDLLLSNMSVGYFYDMEEVNFPEKISHIDSIAFYNDDYESSKIDPNLYIAVKLKWYIAGETVSATVNGISNKTVQDKNLEELYKAEKTMPGITLKLPNLIEYYTDNEYIVARDINQPIDRSV